MSKTRWTTVVLLCAFGCSAEAADMLLRVYGSEPEMRGWPISLDGHFVGVVGDAVTITPVNHRLTIELPSGLKADYDILTKEGRVNATAVTESTCLGTASWWVGSPTAPRVQREVDGSAVILPVPAVRLEGICPVDLPNLTCMWRQASLHIHAIPEVGAEVWIERVQLSGTTSKTLDLGYCGGTAPRVEFLLRKPGYVTCQASIKIQDEPGEYDVGCALRKL